MLISPDYETCENEELFLQISQLSSEDTLTIVVFPQHSNLVEKPRVWIKLSFGVIFLLILPHNFSD